MKAGARCECDRVEVLCSCGWGSLSMPACEVPEYCPCCGFDLWGLGGTPAPCTLAGVAQ